MNALKNLSPHTLQNPNSVYYEKFERVLTDDYPEQPYSRRRHEDKTMAHVGQRKLHMSEVEFLTQCCCNLFDKPRKKIVVIYAGAAHGVHIPTLINMFPFIEYVLIDPGKFQIDHSTYSEKVKCKIVNSFMDNSMAKKLYKQYSDYYRLFISDIRTSDIREKNDKEREDSIMKDMNAQKDWYYILKPFKSMFKFRLPYVGSNKDAVTKINYLDGEIHFQLWAGCTSSETRLFVGENAKLKSYDCVKYENQLFRFNTKERTYCYKHDVQLPGIDHCYDCYAEVYIHEQYLKNFEKIESFCLDVPIEKKSVSEYMDLLTKNIRADKRMIKLIYKGELHYVMFTNMTYGKTADEVFTDYTKSSQSDEVRNYYRTEAKYLNSDSDDDTKPKFKFGSNKRRHDNDDHSGVKRRFYANEKSDVKSRVPFTNYKRKYYK